METTDTCKYYAVIYQDNTPFKGDRSSSTWAINAQEAEGKFLKSLRNQPFKPNGNGLQIMTREKFEATYKSFFVYFHNGGPEEHFTPILAENDEEATAKFKQRHSDKTILRIITRKQFEKIKVQKHHPDKKRVAKPIKAGDLIATPYQPVAA